MKFFKRSWFKKKQPTETVEKKSLSSLGFSDFLISYGHYDLEAYFVIGLFCRTAPLGNAVDILASEIASLIPQVRNIKNNEVVPDHSVLKLLKTPNSRAKIFNYSQPD